MLVLKLPGLVPLLLRTQDVRFLEPADANCQLAGLINLAKSIAIFGSRRVEENHRVNPVELTILL